MCSVATACVALSLLMSLASCVAPAPVKTDNAQQAPQADPSPEYIDMRQGLRLSEADVKRLSGLAKAAHKLANYYLVIRHDVRRTIAWWRVGARLGDADSQYNVGVTLLEQRSLRSKREGLEWLRIAARDGDPGNKDAYERALRASADW